MPARINCQLIEKKVLSEGVTEFSFKSQSSFNFTAGQYLWLLIKNTRRAFSISSSPKEEYLRLIIKKTDSDFSRSIFGLEVGGEVKIYGPFGYFLERGYRKDRLEEPQNRIFIAGGVGIAPFLSVIRFNQRQTEKLPLTLLHSASSEAEFFFREEIENYSKDNNKLAYYPTAGAPDKSRLEQLKSTNPNTHWYIAGSIGFVTKVNSDLKGLGIVNDYLYFEENYPEDKYSGEIFANFLNQDTENNIFKRAVDDGYSHIVITDPNGKIMYANYAAQTITGYTFTEMKGQTSRLWGGYESPEIYQKMWKTIKYDKKPFRGSFTNCRKNGQIYNVTGTISPILDDDQNLLGFIGMEQDITKQVKAEEELKSMAAIVESSRDAILSIDLKGIVLSWNKGAELMYGYSASEIVGEDVSVIFPDDQKAQLPEILVNIGHGAFVNRLQAKRVRKDGTILDVEITISPLYDKNGKVYAGASIIRDITEQKRERENTQRMNKLMVNRELRMIELKEKLKRYENQN